MKTILGAMAVGGLLLAGGGSVSAGGGVATASDKRSEVHACVKAKRKARKGNRTPVSHCGCRCTGNVMTGWLCYVEYED